MNRKRNKEISLAIPIINSPADNHCNYNLCERDQNQEGKWNYPISLSVTSGNQIKVLRVRQMRGDKSERKRAGAHAQPSGGPGQLVTPGEHKDPWMHVLRGTENAKMALKATHCLVIGKPRGPSGSDRLSLGRTLRAEHWDRKSTALEQVEKE